MKFYDSPAALAAHDPPADPALARLLALRRAQLLADDGDSGDLRFVIVEPGDTLPEIEAAAGVPIATSLVDGSAFPDSDFVPCWEWCLVHQGWTEISMVLNDDGSGAVLFVPRRDDIDPRLIAIIRTFPDDASTLIEGD